MIRALRSLAAAAAVALALASSTTFADPPAPAPHRPLTEVETDEFLTALRPYLEPESPMAFRSRIELINVAKRLKDAGCDVLADVDALRALLYRARPFLRPFEKKPMDAGKDYEVHIDGASGVMSVRSDALRLGISVPKAYTDAIAQKKLDASTPFPMIVVLHDAHDYEDAKAAKPWPGEEAIKRLYPKASMKAVTDRAIVYAPVASKARFTDGENVLAEKIPLHAIWKRYQVDFDRLVIDGGHEALLFAAAYPTFYAGVIVRGDATDIAPDLVPNLGATFVYVVQTGTNVPPVVATLRRAGHPADKLQVGPPTAIAEWLAGVKRVPPKSFRWVVTDPSAHRLAQWINIETLDPNARRPTLGVEVVDTVDDPNTVRINSVGIRGITIFLSDAIVDLDRDVRVVINGKMLEECRIESNKPEGTAVRLPAKFARTVDGMFDRKNVRIRASMFYGWLYPVALEQIAIESDLAPPAAPDPEQAQEAADAEFAFAVGDLEHRRGEPIETTDPVAQAIAWVRDIVWRPRTDPPTLVIQGPRDAIRAQGAWLVGTDAAARSRSLLGVPKAPSTRDELPVVSALVLDRIRRERDGVHSTRADGPLAPLVDRAYIAYFIDEWVPGAYGGPGAVKNRNVEVERTQARELRDTAARNAWLGGASVAGLLALAAVGGLVAGRRRQGPSTAPSGAPAGGESEPLPPSPASPPTRSSD